MVETIRVPTATAPTQAAQSLGGLTVFLPVHNGADVIEPVLDAFCSRVVTPTGARLLVCEDGSTDGTEKLLEHLAAKYPMRLQTGRTRKGYATAVGDGLRSVDTPFVFFADSDGQYYPEDFWKLLPYAKDGDMVIGRKVNRDEPLHRILLSRGFHLLAKAMTGVPLTDMDCGFRILRHDVIERILPEVGSLPYSFWAEFSILAYRRGMHILEVPVSHRSRPSGTSTIYRWDKLPVIVIRQFIGLVRLSRRLRRVDRAGPA